MEQEHRQMEEEESVNMSSKEMSSRGNDLLNSQGGYSTDELSTSTNTNDGVKNIYVHRNGDIFEPAKRFVYNKKQIRTWDAFLQHLTQTMKPRTGPVRDIYTPKTGTRVSDFENIIPNTNYVAVAGKDKMQLLGYLNLTKEMEAAKKRRNYQILSQSASEPTTTTYVARRPIVSGRIKYELQKRGKTIHVFRNGDEYTRAIGVLLKPMEQKTMGMILKAVGDKVVLPTNRPILKLYTMEGDLVADPDLLEENNIYVAAGHEPFINCIYGQNLPQILFGPKKQDKIRFLNSVSTPMLGKQRQSHNYSTATSSDQQVVISSSPRTHRLTGTQEISPRKSHRNKQKPVAQSEDYSSKQPVKYDEVVTGQKENRNKKDDHNNNTNNININNRDDDVDIQIQARKKADKTNNGKQKKERNEINKKPHNQPVTNDDDSDVVESSLDMGNNDDFPLEHSRPRRFSLVKAASVIQASYRGYSYRMMNVV